MMRGSQYHLYELEDQECLSHQFTLAAVFALISGCWNREYKLMMMTYENIWIKNEVIIPLSIWLHFIGKRLVTLFKLFFVDCLLVFYKNYIGLVSMHHSWCSFCCSTTMFLLSERYMLYWQIYLCRCWKGSLSLCYTFSYLFFWFLVPQAAIYEAALRWGFDLTIFAKDSSMTLILAFVVPWQPVEAPSLTRSENW